MKRKALLSILLTLAVLLSLSAFSASAETTDEDAQLSLIFSKLSEFRQDESSNKWYYCVTDLDRNGRMELIAASQHPADRSTNLKVWEVSEGRDKLEECKLRLEEDESFPDILSDNADTYFMKDKGVWSYMFYDNIVLSDKEVYTLKCSVSLVNGEVGYESYAVEHTEITGGYTTVSHTDSMGFAISPEQYNASGVNAFAGAERSNTNFDWFLFTDASMSRLADSYAVFAGLREPTEILPIPKPAALQQPTASPTPAPAPSVAPTPVPAPTPAPKPTYLMITKNPTNENKKEGQTALFVACANVFDSLNWTLVAPNGGEYSVQNFRSIFYGSNVSGEYGTTLSIENVKADMNNWGAYCTFYYNGQTARTSTAYIYVKGSSPTPTPPTPQPSGILNGTVVDYTFSTITLMYGNQDTVVVPLSICDISGNLGVGCFCNIYYDGMIGKTPNVYYVYIEGETPIVGPVYGSMAGSAYHDTAFTVYIILQNGTSVTVSGDICNLIGGSLEDGCTCTVYYMNYPSNENIYQVDIYGVQPIVYEPDTPWTDDTWDDGYPVDDWTGDPWDDEYPVDDWTENPWTDDTWDDTVIENG